MQDPQASRRNQWYECCHGPEDNCTVEPQAKLPEPGHRQTKKDWGASVKTGCTAKFVVKQRGAVSLIQMGPEPHAKHPDLNQSQVGPYHPVKHAESGALLSYKICVCIPAANEYVVNLVNLPSYIMVG
jgi:hypothetical protein